MTVNDIRERIRYFKWLFIFVFAVGSILWIRYQSSVFSVHTSSLPSPTISYELPRRAIITYTVGEADTFDSVARRFNISVDTIKWANEIASDTLSSGETLKILPITGIAHIVIKGDTVETLARKYDTTPSKIIDFPFNKFSDPKTHSLLIGETLIIPDGSL